MRSYTDNVLQCRRLAWLIYGMAFLGIILFARLFWIQVVSHSYYSRQAKLEQTRKYELPARRGQLYTNDSGILAPVALNQTLKLLYADPRFVVDKADTAKKLAQITGADANEYQKRLENGIQYAILDTRLSVDTASKIKKLKLPGIGMSDRDYRVYPEGSLASQVLGFVNSDGVGQYGIEGFLNDELNGTPGKLSGKTDTSGIPIQTSANENVAAIDGKSYVLTIDRNIQAMVEKILSDQVVSTKAKSGSVIVLDPKTGAVKAMANYPTFDPNNYAKVTDYSTFSNFSVSSNFEPGSGLKAFTVAAGLDQGKIEPTTTYDDTGCVQISDARICNAENHRGGPNTPMTTVLRDSLNTGVVHILNLLGGDANKITLAGKKTLYDYFTKRFGFGVRTGIEQSNEASGSVNPPTSNNVNYANMTFGQGIAVTMIQMVAAMGAIANGGKYIQPHLVAGTVSDIGTLVPQSPKIINARAISPESAAKLGPMLELVVERGSGYLASTKGYRIAGKTGTAQIPRPDGKGYIDGVNIGSFIGYAPAEDPKFVVMVVINQPGVSGYAESTTVPVFRDIIRWLFNYYSIAPSK